VNGMKKISGYVKEYFRFLGWLHFFSSAVFIGAAIFCNYYFGINKAIYTLTAIEQATAWFLIFLIVFHFGYFIQTPHPKTKLFQNPMFLFFSVFAAALFAWKMTAHFEFQFTAGTIQNAYWNQVVYWPLKLVMVAVALFFMWKRFNSGQPFYGTAIKSFSVKPYLLLLLLMIPLLLLASTQPDFLAVYPKWRNSAFLSNGGTLAHKLLYELSYGLDFVTIELFFRGFLVLAFTKWAGQKTVLPMALFYCTIHFGKPLGECISSFFGGLILGAVTFHTRSIWGGLIVHVGIAWLMELFGGFFSSGAGT
jgi:hypothetical protein